MAFSYTVTVPDGTLVGREQIFAGLVLKSGTWDAAGVTLGTIVTGLTKVIAYQTRTDSGTITDEHRSKKNVDGSGTAALGSIGILTTVSGNTGSWMAIGY
jgi:hypothetical protein